MRQIRTAVFMTWLIGVTAVLGLVGLPLLALPRRFAWIPYDIWVRAVLGGFATIIGVHVVVRGQDHLPTDGRPVLLASKHQAMWDTVKVFDLLPHPAVILKRELLFLPIYGWFATKLGMIGIDRAAHASALRRMVAESRARLDEGRSIVIFPEGTRTAPGAPADYKPGVAALYRQLNVPCVPVALNSGLCWPGHGFDFRPGTITLDVLEPIPPGLPRHAFLETLRERIETASDRLLQEIPTRQSSQR